MAEILLPIAVFGTGMGVYVYNTSTTGGLVKITQAATKAPPSGGEYQEPGWDVLDPLQNGWKPRGMRQYGQEAGKFGLPRFIFSQFRSSQKRDYSLNERSL